MSELPRFKSPFGTSPEKRSVSPESDNTSRRGSAVPFFPKRLSLVLSGDGSRKGSVASFHGDLLEEKARKQRKAFWLKVLTCTSLVLLGLMAGILIGFYAIPHPTSASSTAVATTTEAALAATTSGFAEVESKAKTNDKNNNVPVQKGSNKQVTSSSSTSSTSTKATSSTLATTAKTSSTSTAKTSSSSATASATSTKAYWQPTTGTSFQIVLSSVISAADAAAASSSSWTAYDTDLFDTPTATITALKAAGKKVICYFSAGTAEDWRSDYSSFTSSDKGAALGDWAGEYWLDTRSTNVRSIMSARLDLAASKGCDGVDPDNIDVYGYTNSGFTGLTTTTSIDYVTYLANAAHSRGLAIGLKNGGTILPDVVSYFQYSITESCVDWSECSIYQPFVSAGKPVFNIEYPFSGDSSESSESTITTSIKSKFCSTSGTSGTSILLKHTALDNWVYNC